MQNPESLFNPNENAVGVESLLSQEHLDLLQAKAKELGLDFETVLEITIANYYPITQQDIEKYEQLQSLEKQEKEGL